MAVKSMSETLYPEDFEEKLSDVRLTPKRIQRLMFDVFKRDWVVSLEEYVARSLEYFTLTATSRDDRRSLTLTYPVSILRDRTLDFFEQQIRARVERLLPLHK